MVIIDGWIRSLSIGAGSAPFPSTRISGVVTGGALGILDGLTAWFTPEVRLMLMGIVIGSTLNGVVAGVAAGMFARKVRNLTAGGHVGSVGLTRPAPVRYSPADSQASVL